MPPSVLIVDEEPMAREVVARHLVLGIVTVHAPGCEPSRQWTDPAGDIARTLAGR